MNMTYSPEPSESDYVRIRAVKDAAESTLLEKANVVGVGIGLVDSGSDQASRLGIVVMVSRKVPIQHLAPADVIPKEIDGIPILVQEVGELKAAKLDDS